MLAPTHELAGSGSRVRAACALTKLARGRPQRAAVRGV